MSNSENQENIRRRVVFLFGHLHKGGMQKAVSNISCALPIDIKQYVVFFGTENPGFNYNAEMVDLNVPGSKYLGAFSKLNNFLKRVKRLQNFIDNNDIDIVVSFGEMANIINIFTRRKKTILSVRVSIREAFSESTWIYREAYLFLVRLLYKRADKIVAVSKAIASNLVDEYSVPENKIEVIYNLYDIEKIRNMASEPLDSGAAEIFKRRVVITVGTLGHQKGQEHIIRAFSLVKKSIRDLELIIIGRGDLHQYLEKLSRKLGIGDSVHLLGFQSNPYKYLSKASVFTFTSRYEGLPNALIEAMICGLPVIATDCKTGPREIIGDSKYGILLPDITGKNQDEVEKLLAQWVISMMKTGIGEDYRKKASLRVHAFDKENIKQKWIDLLFHTSIP